MNETEYITDFSTVQTSLPDNQLAEDIETATEVTETSLVTSISTPPDYDFKHIQNNTDGILLMTTGTFFLFVIVVLSKLFGGFLSM